MNDLAVLSGEKPVKVEITIDYKSAIVLGVVLFLAMSLAILVYQNGKATA